MAAILVHVMLLCLTNSELLGQSASEQRHQRRLREIQVFPADELSDTSSQDMVSMHMFKLYDKYNRELNRPKDGNTVRSFKGSPEISEQGVLYQFNFTSIQESEVVLAATVHFFFNKRPRQRMWPCKQLRGPSCHLQHLYLLPPFQLLLRSTPRNGAPGVLLGNITLIPHRRGTWHIRDISHILKEARQMSELLITAEFDFGERYQRYIEQPSALSLPYVLVYADDLSISEPNSVARTLQRYDPFPVAGEPSQSLNFSPNARVKRDTYASDPIENNELPEVEYNSLNKHEMLENTYLALKTKPSKKERRRKVQEVRDGLNQSPVLSFDEKTMKKARQRQRDESRICSRRYLKVDFADIGWSEWILFPKSFDAYYCSGTCQFPMSKLVRPSNHATIQSIVKAVGIVLGVPEPCCVADKMNPLSVLFLDEGRNVVLKVYPSMSVETCACR
ncbi:growth/differentiation factor 10 [Scleropages formosus]|nr:growth/differentiation factor 10-like [Scleropages formosus]